MGLLKNQRYWANAANEIHNLRPSKGEPMPQAKVLEILKTACRSLSDLTADPSFHTDLSEAVELARAAEVEINTIRDTPYFADFIDEFIRAEKDILWQAGVEFDTAQEMLSNVIELAKIEIPDSQHLDRLDDKIKYCAKLACTGHLDLKKLSELRPIGDDLKKVVYGVSFIGIDFAAPAAATIAFPAAVAAYPLLLKIPGISIGTGASKIWDAIKGRW